MFVILNGHSCLNLKSDSQDDLFQVIREGWRQAVCLILDNMADGVNSRQVSMDKRDVLTPTADTDNNS